MANHRLSIGSCSLEYDAEVAFVKHTTAQGPRVSITSDEFNFSLGEHRLKQALAAESVNVPPSEAVAEDVGVVDVPPTKAVAEDAGMGNEDEAVIEGGSDRDEDLQPSRAEEDDLIGTLEPENPEESANEKETRTEDPCESEFKPVGQKILVVYGPSGQGRSHVVQKLVHASPSVFCLVVQHTTRKRRPSEISGVDFHFISRKDMMAQIRRGAFVEHTTLSSKKNKRRSNAVADVDAESRQPSPTAETRHKELLGTSRLALQEAQQRGKPCVVLNVTTHGAQQLRDAKEDGIFVLLFAGEDPKAHSKEMKVEPDYAISIDNLERGYTELKQFAVQQLGMKPGSHPTVEGSPTTAREEWIGIPTLEMDRVGGGADHETPMPALARVITFSELLAHFQSTAFSGRIEAFVRSEQQKGTPTALSRIFSQHRLAKKLHRERNLILAVASCRFDNHEPLHLLALQTAYHKLTGSAVACRRFGPHWQDIGFRGVDPADDLRGVGLLGLTQLLCLVDSPRTLEFVREVYQFSLERSHAAPFSVLSLSLTGAVLSALRDNLLAKICNKRDQVFAVANEFHAALLYRVYQRWRAGARGEPELGALLQEVERHARDNVKRTLLEWESYLKSREEEWQLSRSLPGQGSAEPSATGFTPLEQYSSFTDQ